MYLLSSPDCMWYNLCKAIKALLISDCAEGASGVTASPISFASSAIPAEAGNYISPMQAITQIQGLKKKMEYQKREGKKRNALIPC